MSVQAPPRAPRAVSSSHLVEIEAELCALHASIESSQVRMLTLVATVDRDGSWVLTGATSTADWLCKVLDIEAELLDIEAELLDLIADHPAVRLPAVLAIWQQRHDAAQEFALLMAVPPGASWS
jgi:hypothetical protein